MKMTTYEMLKRLITVDKAAGKVDDAYKEDMMFKLDVFFAGNRITADEYKELVALLNS